MGKMLDYDLKVREFKLQSWYYVHFTNNILGKDMNPVITPASYGLNSLTAVLLQEWIWH